MVQRKSIHLLKLKYSLRCGNSVDIIVGNGEIWCVLSLFCFGVWHLLGKMNLFIDVFAVGADILLCGGVVRRESILMTSF